MKKYVLMTIAFFVAFAPSFSQSREEIEAAKQQMLEMAQKIAAENGETLDTTGWSSFDPTHRPSSDSIALPDYNMLDQYKNAPKKTRENINKFTKKMGLPTINYSDEDMFGSEDELQRDINDLTRDDAEGMDEFRRQVIDSMLAHGCDTAQIIEMYGDNWTKASQKLIGKEYGDSIGIFKYVDGRFIRVQKIESDAANLKGGIVGSDLRIQFEGGTSKNIFNGKAHFRLYFSHDPNSVSNDLSEFTGKHTINDFFVRKFTVVRGIIDRDRYVRHITIARRNPLGKISSTVTKNSDGVTVQIKETRDNVYDMFVTAKPGEYCIIYNDKDSQFARGSLDVYDFTIK